MPVRGIIFRMIATRSVVASVGAWTVGAGIALAVSLLALSMVSTGLTTEPVQPVTRDVGASANQPTPTPSPLPSGFAAADPPTAPVTAPSRAASATPKGATPGDVAANQRSLSSVGGTVVANCRTGGAYLVYWSPAPGYRVDDVSRGPAEPARLQFEGQGLEVKVSVSCVTGTPQATVRQEAHSAGT
jgi:hypothetical protein